LQTRDDPRKHGLSTGPRPSHDHELPRSSSAESRNITGLPDIVASVLPSDVGSRTRQVVQVRAANTQKRLESPSQSRTQGKCQSYAACLTNDDDYRQHRLRSRFSGEDDITPTRIMGGSSSSCGGCPTARENPPIVTGGIEVPFSLKPLTGKPSVSALTIQFTLRGRQRDILHQDLSIFVTSRPPRIIPRGRQHSRASGTTPVYALSRRVSCGGLRRGRQYSQNRKTGRGG